MSSSPTIRPASARRHSVAVLERPRERMLAHGAQALTSAELLALVLRTGSAGCSNIGLAHKLLDRFGSLRQLLAAPASQLTTITGIGDAKACELLAVSELHRRALEEELRQGINLERTEDVKRYCIARLGHLKIEHCITLYLDNQLRLLVAEETARGTVTRAHVYPAEITRAAITHHAVAVILAHNHPSGVLRASQADIDMTRQVLDALKQVEIRLVDHIVVGGNDAISMRTLHLL